MNTSSNSQDNDPYYSFVDEGICLYKKKDYVAALCHFMSAFRLRPEAPVLLFNIGTTMEELGDIKAEDFLLAAINKGNTDALYQLGWLYISKGRNEEAVGVLRDYISRVKGIESEHTYIQWAKAQLDRLAPGPRLVVKNGSDRKLSSQNMS
jgi:tetratricopeptide (TPR) repeat protein